MLPLCAGPFNTFKYRVEGAKCAQTVASQVSAECHSSCAVSCNRLEVKSTVSVALWPRPSQQLALYEKYIRGRPYDNKFEAYEKIYQEWLETGNVSATLYALGQNNWITKNFIMVEIIRAQLGVEIVADQQKTTGADLISTIGSLMNLYSGITVIIVVELIDFLYQLIIVIFFNQKEELDDKDKKKPPKDSENIIQHRNGSMQMQENVNCSSVSILI
jgi:hypothetical protein